VAPESVAVDQDGFGQSSKVQEAAILLSSHNIPRPPGHKEVPVVLGEGVFDPVLDHTQHSLLDLEGLVL